MVRKRKRGSIDPWVRKIPCRKDGNPLQYTCLEKPMDRGAWRGTVHGVAKSQTRLKGLSTHAPPNKMVRESLWREVACELRPGDERSWL